MMKDSLGDIFQNGFRIFAETAENLNKKRNAITEHLETSLGDFLSQGKEKKQSPDGSIPETIGEAIRSHLEEIYSTTSPIKNALEEIKKSLDSGGDPELMKAKLEEIKSAIKNLK